MGILWWKDIILKLSVRYLSSWKVWFWIRHWKKRQFQNLGVISKELSIGRKKRESFCFVKVASRCSLFTPFNSRRGSSLMTWARLFLACVQFYIKRNKMFSLLFFKQRPCGSIICFHFHFLFIFSPPPTRTSAKSFLTTVDATLLTSLPNPTFLSLLRADTGTTIQSKVCWKFEKRWHCANISSPAANKINFTRSVSRSTKECESHHHHQNFDKNLILWKNLSWTGTWFMIRWTKYSTGEVDTLVKKKL